MREQSTAASLLKGSASPHGGGLSMFMARHAYAMALFCVGLPVVFGLFMPLMENDSAQHATMAMTMAKSMDFLHLFKGGEPYLDKPHMHFWLAALSYKAFGYHAWAYRLPSILVMMIGALSVYRLGAVVFKEERIGQIASLMLLTAQGILLALHDVRTDAVLTGFTALGLAYWLLFFERGRRWDAVLGGVGLALAFSTKGQVAVMLVGLTCLLFIIHRGYASRLVSFNFLLGVVASIIVALPSLYAYHTQFGWEGVRFLLYEQCTGRMTGQHFGDEGAKDYAFYFHSMLWAFLPWSLLFFIATYDRMRRWTLGRRSSDWALALTFLIYMIGMNFSQYKLPHYLNVAFPIAAVVTASYLVDLSNGKHYRHLRSLRIVQWVVIGLTFVLAGGIALASQFFIREHMLILLVIGLLVVGLYASIRWYRQDYQLLYAITYPSVLIAAIANLYLNTMFYPAILEYQGGDRLGEYWVSMAEPDESVYMLEDDYSWSFDLWYGATTPSIDILSLHQSTSPTWVMAYDWTTEDFRREGFFILDIKEVDQYHVTKLSAKFLLPHKRQDALKRASLARVISVTNRD